MGFQERTQQLPQGAGVEWPFAKTLVQVQVEPGHMNATDIGIDQVHIGGNQCC